VTRDVPDFALAYGSPARVHGHVGRCGSTLLFEEGGAPASCSCGRRYGRGDDGHVRELA